MHAESAQTLLLMQAISRFYPVGLSVEREFHEGFQKIREITLNKNYAAENNSPKRWFEMIDQVRKDWNGLEVINLAGTPFPGYRMIIFVDQQQSINEPAVMLTLSLSLLVANYTVFITDIHRDKNSGKELKLASHIITDGNNHRLKLTDKIQQLKNTLNHYFPEYSFVHPKILFTHKVEGAYAYAGNQQELDKDVIYDYLFSHDMTGLEYEYR